MMRGKNGEEKASALVSCLGLLQMAPGDKGQVAFLWAKFLKPQVIHNNGCWKSLLPRELCLGGERMN